MILKSKHNRLMCLQEYIGYQLQVEYCVQDKVWYQLVEKVNDQIWTRSGALIKDQANET